MQRVISRSPSQDDAFAAFGGNITKVGPQPGPQTAFASCPADIAIYGGAAGSGKSFALELEPLRNVTSNRGFSCVIFRRNTTSIRAPGALWDQSLQLYKEQGGEPRESTLEWMWGSGGKIKFAHLEHENTVFDWHGAQVPLICFDELTEFTEKQFFYMVSRNRSMCGVRPYIRATCNPDADSWVARFIDWWIDPDTGLPIPARSGKIRYMVRVGDDIKWASRKEDLTPEKLGVPRYVTMADGTAKEVEFRPLSVTFISANIYDNQELLRTDTDYLAKLMALPTVERERLLGGNWKIRPAPGLFFNRNWCEVVDEVPEGLIYRRGWDLAATAKTQNNDPDATESVKIGKDVLKKIYYVVDAAGLFGTPNQVDAFIKRKAIEEDGREVEQWLPQDPGQAGKHQARYFNTLLDGVACKTTPEVGNKETRFSPFSSAAEGGRVKVLRGRWNAAWFAQLESFPDEGAKDDKVDATSRAFNAFLDGTTGLLEHMQAEAERLRQEGLAQRGDEITTDADGVRVVPPPGVNQLYDMKGRLLQLQGDGTFLVTKKHAEALRRSPGFSVPLTN